MEIYCVHPTVHAWGNILYEFLLFAFVFQSNSFRWTRVYDFTALLNTRIDLMTARELNMFDATLWGDVLQKVTMYYWHSKKPRGYNEPNDFEDNKKDKNAILNRNKHIIMLLHYLKYFSLKYLKLLGKYSFIIIVFAIFTLALLFPSQYSI